ncbi:unnamed protein product [Owenia fusiformis]|uniref:Gamma-glutamyltransferase n=1 Tax=Owenia fusiformis TaxID=6347 RepID=A0A8S4Q521_OWEFU|nr:unnamed protein product [Owenia fusiformis]
MGVVKPQLTGVGGGLFMLLRDSKSGVVEAIDGRETAPLLANKTMFVGRTDDSKLGPLSIAVPSLVRGLWTAFTKFGSEQVKWFDLLTPSIKLCKEGIVVTDELGKDIGFVIELIQNAEKEYPQEAPFHNKAEGRPYKARDIMFRPKYGATLQQIATDPLSLDRTIANEIQKMGGIITEQDLKSYNAIVKDPLVTHLENGDLSVYGIPPPSSSAVLQYILNILDGYNFNSTDCSEIDFESDSTSVTCHHRLIESFKWAYAKRAKLGDEEYVDQKYILREMLSQTTAAQTRARIFGDKTFHPSYYGETFYDRLTKGTAHTSIVDENGGIAAFTSSLNFGFGSGLVGNTTGIVYNNEMDDFSTPFTKNLHGFVASPANFIKPGKRPLSSMGPVIILNSTSNKVKLVLGGIGGSRIPTATAYVAVRHLWLGEDIQTAIYNPRLHHQLLPNTIIQFGDFPKNILRGLSSIGHSIREEYDFMGMIQGIAVINGTLEAACDYRRICGTDGY